MKANYFVLLCLLFSFLRVQAQFVTVPDPVFANWISKKAPGCINGSQLDTTCTGLFSIKQALLSDSGIYDLTGIAYLDSLEGLDCSRNFLTILPPLPARLEALVCNSNLLTQLPDLPVSLQYLYCDSNRMTTLPVLPLNLEILKCSNNQLTQLPALPANLRELQCYYNQLTLMPVMGDSLWSLGCGYNQLHNIANFGVSIRSVHCGNNQLTSLPPFPPGLEHLRCSNNYLNQLPALSGNLRSLYCENNLLTSLPDLTSPNIYLVCSDNLLTALPLISGFPNEVKCERNLLVDISGLPSKVVKLNLSENPISDLSQLPDTTFTLYISGCENVSCFPVNKHVNYLYWDGSGIVCFTDKLNIDGANPKIGIDQFCNEYMHEPCALNQNINGRIVWDQNSNCLVDSADPGCAFVKVIADSAGYKIAQTYTDENGKYFFGLEAGVYSVIIDSTATPYLLSCNQFAEHPVTISISNKVNDNIDFLVSCPSGFDVGVRSVVSQSGFVKLNEPSYFRVVVAEMSSEKNLECFNSVSGKVKFVLSGPVHFTNNNGQGQLTGDTLSYDVADFTVPMKGWEVELEVEPDVEADEGEEGCLWVFVDPVSGDSHTDNNSFKYCFRIKDAKLENELSVSPIAVIDTSEQWLTYTVYFRNTTGALVENLQVTDVIGYKLDTTSFELTGFSHQPFVRAYYWTIIFSFPDIQLPSSQIDEEHSEGYVQFRIKRLPWLYVGQKITNEAKIKIDHSIAFVTNTTENVIGVNTWQEEIETINDEPVFLYPNPVGSGSELNIWLEHFVDQSFNIDVFDMSGRFICNLNTTLDDHLGRLQLPALDAGVYCVNIYSETLIGKLRMIVD